MQTLKTFSGHKASQNPWELAQFIALLVERKVRRYLEIGAREGDTWHAVGCALDSTQLGALTVAVDWPGAKWGYKQSIDLLHHAGRDLRRNHGWDDKIRLGSSQDPEIIASVAAYSPYDAILIDGDHRYDGVKADWAVYGGMAPLVAFHDIAGHGVLQKSSGDPVEVPRLWAEIKATGLYECREFIAPDSKMGIGVVINPNWNKP